MATQRQVQVALNFTRGESELNFLKQLIDSPSIPVRLNVTGLDKAVEAGKTVTALSDLLNNLGKLEYKAKVSLSLPQETTLNRLKELTSALKEFASTAGQIKDLNLSNIRITAANASTGSSASSSASISNSSPVIGWRVGQGPSSPISTGVRYTNNQQLTGRSPSPRSYTLVDQITAPYDDRLSPVPTTTSISGPYSRLGTAEENRNTSRAVGLLNDKLLTQYRVNQLFGRSEENENLLTGLSKSTGAPLDLLKNRVGTDSRLQKVLSAGRLLNPEALSQVAYGFLAGGATGAIGSTVGGLLGGAPGALAGGLVANVGNELTGKVFERIGEAMNKATESGIRFEQSVQSIGAAFHANSQIVGAVNISEEISAQQQRARSLQVSVRPKLLQLGIGGETENVIVRSLVEGLGQRGVSLNADQTATIAQRLGASVSLIRPDLLQNPTRLQSDIADLLSGSPQASRTSIAQAIGKSGTAKIESAVASGDPERILQATQRLQSFVEAVTHSGLAVQQFNRIAGTQENIMSRVGAAWTESLTPALKMFADGLEEGHFEETLPIIAKGLGVVGGLFVQLGAGLITLIGDLNDAVVRILRLLGLLPKGDDEQKQAVTRKEVRAQGLLSQAGMDEKTLSAGIVDLQNEPQDKANALEKARKTLIGTPDYNLSSVILSRSRRDYLQKEFDEQSKSVGGITGNAAEPFWQRQLADLENQKSELELNKKSTKVQARFEINQAREAYENGNQDAYTQHLQKARDLMESMKEASKAQAEIEKDKVSTLQHIINNRKEELGIIRQQAQLREAAIVGQGPGFDSLRLSIRSTSLGKENANLDSQISTLRTQYQSAQTNEQKSRINTEIDTIGLQKNANLAQINDIKDKQTHALPLQSLNQRVSAQKISEQFYDSIFQFGNKLADLKDSFTTAQRAVEDFSRSARIANLSGQERLIEMAKQIQERGGTVPISPELISRLPASVSAALQMPDKATSDEVQTKLLEAQFEQAGKDFVRTDDDNKAGGTVQQKLLRNRDTVSKDISDLQTRGPRDIWDQFINSSSSLLDSLTKEQISSSPFFTSLDNARNSNIETLFPQGGVNDAESAFAKIAGAGLPTNMSDLKVRYNGGGVSTLPYDGRSGSSASGSQSASSGSSGPQNPGQLLNSILRSIDSGFKSVNSGLETLNKGIYSNFKQAMNDVFEGA